MHDTLNTMAACIIYYIARDVIITCIVTINKLTLAPVTNDGQCNNAQSFIITVKNNKRPEDAGIALIC